MSRQRWHSVKDIRIADVARLAGVSTATVSRVLSDPDKVRQKTCDLVMEAVRRSGYTPDRTAQNLRTRRTMNVLVVAPRLTNPVFAQVLRGVDDELTRCGYGIIVGNLDNQREREPRYVALALSRQIDGVLLLTGHVPQDGDRNMKEAGLPIVAMCAAIDDPSIPNVVVQDREAARQAVEYLVRLGHRRFGYISGTPTSIIEVERYAGFVEGVAAGGFSQRDIVRWEGAFVFATGVAAAEAFLRLKKRPTGVFAACDESAIGFVKTVQAAGIRIPQDVSVIGFDGIEVSDYIEPPLTTFRQPMYDMGRAGAQILLNMMQGEAATGIPNVRMPLRLLERGTTSVAPSRARGLKVVA
ncbi:LacI family DNA-binding transcriptional regulator [Microvirga pudoricolor]|uniref:LacI family DNA-binding transcriptional regulator n=1 Tax=Microvirga pudoricolor TaxID=2778729 RepID=UPI001950CB97|nr:LacI family DNA-binding transcriptional regulator [Microvirga pudoricolor]MBM6596541.1 LacI family DNA-binding transcriptional regulator [Microvirga pudoricolor]